MISAQLDANFLRKSIFFWNYSTYISLVVKNEKSDISETHVIGKKKNARLQNSIWATYIPNMSKI